MNRTKMFLWAALAVVALCTASCKKDDDDADKEPEIGDTVKGSTVIDSVTCTRGVGGTVANYIDFGLPSGTLWAEHNLGATKDTELPDLPSI